MWGDTKQPVKRVDTTQTTAGHAGFHCLQNWDRVPMSGSGQARDLRAAARAPVSHKTWETRVEG